MDSVIVVLEKLAFLFLLVSAGFLAARLKLIGDEGIRGASRLLVDIFWPCMVVSSIASQLTRADIISNAVLPLTAFVTALIGLAVGTVASRMLGITGRDKAVFRYDTTINNFIYFPLAFVTTMIPGKGPALLFVQNLGFVLAMWTIGVAVLRGSASIRESLSGALPTGLIATIIGVIIVMTNVKQHTPPEVNRFLFLVFDTIGKPTMAVAMLIAGFEIYKLGIKSLKFDRWNISLGLLRLIVIPALMLGISFGLRAIGVSREALVIFNLVSIMPVSINSISLALRFGASSERAAQAVVFTHLFGIATIAMYMVAIRKFFG